MQIKTIPNTDFSSGTILIPVFETNAKSIVPIEFGEISLASKVFYGKKDAIYLVEKNDTIHIFIGIGKTIDYKSLKTIFRRIASQQKAAFFKNASLVIPPAFTQGQVEAAVSGLMLGTYNLGHFKKDNKHPFLEDDFVLHLVSQTDYIQTANRALKIANAQIETLTLVDLPPNTVTPKYLSQHAQKKGAAFGFEVTVLGEKESLEQGLDAFMAVGKGSDQEPQFVIMTYMPENMNPKTKHIGLVGKGVTFDTGGLNIKTWPEWCI